ncbi:MAG TPA: hypothetical protein VGI68_24415 [Mycobacterium sp.]
MRGNVGLPAVGAGWLVFGHHGVGRAELQQWVATHSDAAPPGG